MKLAAVATLMYALLVLAGGLMDYLQAKSLASLISGLLFGTGFLITGCLIWRESMAAGYVSGFMILLLALYFGYRFISTDKFLPGGVMLITSFFTLFFLLLGLFLKAQETN